MPLVDRNEKQLNKLVITKSEVKDKDFEALVIGKEE
jgi:hypothetical protein